jgi:hypothetical protein
MGNLLMLVSTRERIPDLLAELEGATRAEIIVALREPGRQIVQLLKNRSNDLKICTSSAAKQARAFETPNWGLF